jgi:hypothetical protein
MKPKQINKTISFYFQYGFYEYINMRNDQIAPLDNTLTNSNFTKFIIELEDYII